MCTEDEAHVFEALPKSSLKASKNFNFQSKGLQQPIVQDEFWGEEQSEDGHVSVSIVQYSVLGSKVATSFSFWLNQ